MTFQEACDELKLGKTIAHKMPADKYSLTEYEIVFMINPGEHIFNSKEWYVKEK